MELTEVTSADRGDLKKFVLPPDPFSLGQFHFMSALQEHLEMSQS